MKELALFGDSSEEKSMTVKEVAEALNVSDRTVRRHLSDIRSNLDNVVQVKNGITSTLSEVEVTEIKLRIERSGRNDLPQTKDLPKTDLEKELIIQQAMILQNEKIQRLQEELNANRQKVIVHDQIIDSTGLILPSVAGKMIMKKPNIFIKWLVDDVHVLFRSSGKLRPMAKYQEQGYLEVKEVLNENQNRTYDQVFFTPAGVSWITKKWNLFQKVSK